MIERSATPVLLVVFNRPEATRRVIDALRHNRPRHVYVAADGARDDVPDDRARVGEVRAVVEGIDWDCTLDTRYRPANLGLQDAMIDGITWFFENVDAGVILEDDCVPAASFLPFAGAVLERYADEPRVMHVAGVNMAREPRFAPSSYGFARVGPIWGWGTWRRAWQQFDRTLASWPGAREAYLAEGSALHKVLAHKFDSAHADRKRTWSRAWFWAVTSRDGVAAIPAVNLIENIGYGSDATHTGRRRHPLRHPIVELPLPLRHPETLDVDAAYERLLVRYHRGSYGRMIENLYRSLRSPAAPRS